MLSAGSREAAVLGSPINHSLSPTLHLAAYRALGLTHWSYRAHEINESGLPGFVAGLGPQWAGLSLTMPLKEVAFDVADEVSELAREVGAINTLVRRPDGGWRGENTDVYGVSQALREAGCSQVGSAMVLGSGATARSVVAALVTLGCSRVTFAVRSAARPETLKQAARAGLGVDVIGFDRLAHALGDAALAEVVISTLPAGALSADALPADALPADALTVDPPAADALVTDALPADAPPADAPPSDATPSDARLSDAQAADVRPAGRRLLLDVVYAGWPTPLARIFEESGATVVSGFEMLLHQAAEQVYLMTGLRPPVSAMRTAGLAAMAASSHLDDPRDRDNGGSR
jgi:shikimate dehydrogenase